jgi:ligand-binding sensor domain-containing protein/serine phosphatase RsbU (regulator of sigma subunit)
MDSTLRTVLMPGLRVRYALLCAVALCATGLQAQVSVLFHHLTVKQGLSQGSVNCILQDGKGFIWLGTQDGLNRFDGYTCTVFKHDPGDSLSLSDNFVLGIYEDSTGTLWIRTLNTPGVLNRFDRTRGVFRRVNADSINLAGMQGSTVKAEYNAPGGILWRGSIGGGVTRFDPATGVTTSYKNDPANPNSISDNRVYSLRGDRLGFIWIGTRQGLDCLDPRTGVITHYRHDDADPNSLTDNWVWPILEDRDGILWVGTFKGGLNRFDRRAGTFTRFRHSDANPRSLAGDQLYALYQDQSGMIWVGTNEHGVDRFHPDLNPFQHLANDPANPASLIDNSVLSMYVDRSGVAWVGTQRGVDLFDREKGTFRHLKHDAALPDGIGDNQAQCFTEDRDGNLWIGMVSGGLDMYSPATRKFRHFRHDEKNPRSLSDDRVYALAASSRGGVWVGTYGGGLNYVDPVTGSCTRYQHADSIPSSLGAPGVLSILEDRTGRLWIGTYGGGLDRLDRDSTTFTHYRQSDQDPRSLSDDMVLCLWQDQGGTLWAGTMGGLNRFDPATESFTCYREKDGLPNSMIWGILEDAHGNLWISTNKGLTNFDPRAGTFHSYDYADGLQGDEFNQNAFARDVRTGELYFGGANGFTLFHPDSVQANPYKPPIAFSSFMRYNTDDAAGKPIEERGIDARSEIRISYKDNVAIIEFAALNFFNSFRNQYAYKLEGYSDNWIQLGAERRATFTNLDGGTYTLRVKGSNNAGVWNNDGASLRILVTPPWWKTPWAYAGYTLLVFGAFFSLRRFELNRREQKSRMREATLRAKAMEAENRALEAENERKTKELEDARKLQLSMLPHTIPQLQEYRIAVSMRTATEVGGDYYDFSVGQDGAFDIALGDATGHGMQAGTMVTLMKGLFVSDVQRFGVLPFLRHCSRTIKELRLGRVFMAFTLCRVQGQSFSFSSAGMPPIFHFKKCDGSVEELLLEGMPLGAMKNFAYALHQTTVADGDTILMLTDGLPEQKNAGEEMFNYARVKQALAEVGTRSPEDIIAHLNRAAESWMGTTPQDDDITLLVLQRTPHHA